MASPGVFNDLDPKARVVRKGPGAFWGPRGETLLVEKDQGRPGKGSRVGPVVKCASRSLK